MHILLRPTTPSPIRQLQYALLALLLLLAGGTGGYMWLTDAEPLDALLMTVITITTVGYQHEVDITSTGAKMFTIGLILSAVLVTAWAVRSVAELVFAEYIWAYMGRQRMQRRIDSLKGHIIVCGYGRMGESLVNELQGEGEAFVVIDNREERAEDLLAAGILFVQGDATRDDTLLRAKVKTARALIAVTATDATNIMIALSARALNQNLMISARVNLPESVQKLRRAGADYVLHHHGAGAMHMALSVTHPVVEEVLTHLIPRQGSLDLGQFVVGEDSPLAGQTLAAIGQQRIRALVLAVERAGELMVPPAADEPLRVGDVLVVAGPSGALAALREYTGVQP